MPGDEPIGGHDRLLGAAGDNGQHSEDEKRAHGHAPFDLRILRRFLVNTTTETQLHALMAAVDRAIQAGNNAEADQAIAQARALAPNHPGVLNVAGMRALALGDAPAARFLLQRAAGIDPTPLLWVNVALAHRELGDATAERDALEKALQIDPRYFPALLHK